MDREIDGIYLTLPWEQHDSTKFMFQTLELEIPKKKKQIFLSLLEVYVQYNFTIHLDIL